MLMWSNSQFIENSLYFNLILAIILVYSINFKRLHLRHMQASVSNFILLLIYLTYSLSLRLKTCCFLENQKNRLFIISQLELLLALFFSNRKRK